MIDTMTRERPLADLVRRVHEDGLSFREMAARAHRAGHSISHSQLALYASDGVAKAPTDAQIHALAAALDMGYTQVREAMMQQFYGYTPRELKNMGGSRVAAQIPPDLSPEQEKALGDLVEAWLRTQGRG